MKNKILAVDYKISADSERTLTRMGYNLLKICENKMLDVTVSSHPDMTMSVMGDTLFVDSAIYNSFININVNAVKCSRGFSSENKLNYPYDIEYNCVQVGSNLICNKKYTNGKILEFAKKNGIRIIDSKQGYAKCSTCVVSDNAIITEDDSIERCASENGIDVLKISKGFVKLEGYDYGFIGGASGLIEKNLLAFNGDISKHPDFQKIFKFCYKYSVGIISLSADALYDIGSIIRIM